ncbi:YunC family protein [Novibacillus thermophilus]|mgnify:CR=1 FL=1|jgi:uncharacterized protein YunC (DUF1805 family)|uniref:DUF1805 domain-containing protein n=1 Tax=Novibacillus thermophilus TaxID=1471761 RepID=A0A1U9K732_9BACL|nr:DUF1805 domain-containing protein [Novibacillus thermophilus]AQS55865.1 hypothetical protein B0W44_08750 [Novibacillus thermophilus]
MVQLKPMKFDNELVMGIEVQLPKTNLLIVATDIGYIMCGALDIDLLNTRLADRDIVAGRAVGVKTMEELLEAPLESVTHSAEKHGIQPGMTGRQAVQKMLDRATA